MRLGLTVLIIGSILAWMGICAAFEAAVCWKPQTISYARFVKQRPRVGWYRITDASWDLNKGRFATSRRRRSSDISTVYVPLQAAVRTPNDTKADVIIQTNRNDIRHYVEEVRFETEPQQFPAPQPENGVVEGTIAFGGWNATLRNKMKLRLGNDLAPDFIVINEGKKPNGILGVFLLIAGAGLLGVGGKTLYDKTRLW